MVISSLKSSLLENSNGALTEIELGSTANQSGICITGLTSHTLTTNSNY